MPDGQPDQKPTRNRPGIGFGLFLVLAGLLLLAENLGWLPSKTDWLFPVILIVWGASEIYKRTGWD